MSKNSSRILVVLAAMSLGSTLWADSLITTLYNTGVDNGHTVLLNGQTDSHYVVSPPGGNPFAVTSAGGFPVGPWLGDNTTSTWIRPSNSTPPNDPPASGPDTLYTYTTHFSLTGFNAVTAKIEGKWSSDNYGFDIKINGVSVSTLGGSSFANMPPNAGFSSWYTFSIQSGFVDGDNTLEFLAYNAAQASGNPTGLRVEMVGTAAVPDGGMTLTLLGGILVGLETLRRKFRVLLFLSSLERQEGRSDPALLVFVG